MDKTPPLQNHSLLKNLCRALRSRNADNLMVRTDQSSRLVCRLLTELSGQVYLIYTHAFDPNANRTLLALARLTLRGYP